MRAGGEDMSKSIQKKNRLLDIFYRLMKGEKVSVQNLAHEYEVSTKSISRDINEIKNFLSENREVVGNTELKYISVDKAYSLEFDGFLLNKELMAIIKMMIGTRAFSKIELLEIVEKLRKFTTQKDEIMMKQLIEKEMYHYNQVKHDCDSVIDQIWKLTKCINQQIEITISYYKMNREMVERRIKPLAIMFSEYYYYLIAYHSDTEEYEPIYYRVDRIAKIVEHRGRFKLEEKYRFDEGELREKIQFMFPGKCRRIKFEFTGPSVQAVLDKLPTAKIIDVRENTKVIEAQTYGTGINMFLLSQGSWVKVLEPQELVDEMKNEIEKMKKMYQE